MNGERRVLVMAPNWLGDAVMALPALADLKRHYRDARLTVAARTAVAPIYPLAPDVDEVIALQWRGGATRRRARHEDVEKLRAAGADLAVLFPNSFASAWMVKDVGIRERWGYASDWRGPLLTRRVRRPRRSMHQAAYYQNLVRELGIATGPLDPRLQVPAAVVETARALLVARGWTGTQRMVAIAPGAAYGTAKRWLPLHFARVIDTLARDRQTACVLVGSASDAETTQWILGALGSKARASAIDLAGATSLEVLAGVLSLASACVSNDSGAMHLAGAVGVPLAALFGPTREYETAPLMRQGGRLEVLINPVWCRPCMLRECPIDHRCMKGLTPERVAEAAARLMGATPS
jgi:heptosyltransferase-2